jgi:hypothetical protein
MGQMKNIVYLEFFWKPNLPCFTEKVRGRFAVAKRAFGEILHWKSPTFAKLIREKAAKKPRAELFVRPFGDCLALSHISMSNLT